MSASSFQSPVSSFQFPVFKGSNLSTDPGPRIAHRDLFSVFYFIEHCLQIWRQGRIELDATAVPRMRKCQSRGMQERAFETLDGAQVCRGSPVYASVRLIADDGMSDRAEVDADLMRAAGRDGDVNQ